VPIFESSKAFIAFGINLLPFFHFLGFLGRFAQVSSSPKELSEKSLDSPESLRLLFESLDKLTEPTGAVEGSGRKGL